MKNILILIFCCAISCKIYARDADATFLIADLKYSKEHGVKICEVQNGSLSAFKGDAFSHGDEGLICPHFLAILDEFNMKKWIVTRRLNSWQFKKLPLEWGWNGAESLDLIESNPLFKVCANLPPSDRSDISCYSAILYLNLRLLDLEKFQIQYPGVLVMDAASAPFIGDKYKMSLFFEMDPVLKTFKPEWRLYPKKYSSDLADRIRADIPAAAYVIKPRRASRGIGVIIINEAELDKTLEYILTPSFRLQTDPDPSYNYWSREHVTSFIVEEFCPSDLITLDHFDGKAYQPTMRVAFSSHFQPRRDRYAHSRELLDHSGKSMERRGYAKRKMQLLR